MNMQNKRTKYKDMFTDWVKKSNVNTLIISVCTFILIYYVSLTARVLDLWSLGLLALHKLQNSNTADPGKIFKLCLSSPSDI